MFQVGEVDGRLVATGAVRPAQGYIAEFLDVDEGTAELAMMRVAPAHQGQGYGRGVYEALERRVLDRGFGALVLDTMPSLTAARRLYESEGFEQVGRERFAGREEPFELLFNRKRLVE